MPRPAPSVAAAARSRLGGMVKFGLIPVTALVLCLVVVLTACSNASGSSDDDYAAKYRSAVKGLDHVERVDSSYSSTAGMGSTADLFLHADSSDPAVLEGVMQEAFPAVISAADGDPDANLALQVISKDGSTALSPSDIGYRGTGTLSSYRKFLAG